jgi:hypothetical protein
MQNLPNLLKSYNAVVKGYTVGAPLVGALTLNDLFKFVRFLAQPIKPEQHEWI